MRCLKRSAMVALISAGLVGCGVGQAVKDGTVDAAKWAFTTQVKTMNIDLAGRSLMNPDAAGKSLSTVVRVYQLKDAQRFEASTYEQLQANDLEWLGPDLLATGDVVLRPGAAASIREPMKDDSQYVGVVAFFRDIGGDAVWKLVVPKKQWKKSDPVRIGVRGNTLELL